MKTEADLIVNALFNRVLQQGVNLGHFGRTQGGRDDVLIAAGTNYNCGQNGNGVRMLQRLHHMLTHLMFQVLDFAYEPSHLLTSCVLSDLLLWFIAGFGSGHRWSDPILSGIEGFDILQVTA
jgi:hypothetical protein